MKLGEYLDRDALNEHRRNGDVTAQTDHHLVIFNYSKTHAYENAWTDVTRKTRGLIWDSKKDEILAVPFPKFFNRGERPAEEPPETEAPVAVFDKRDGSLGIVWFFNSTWYVATRGSFASEQAREGAKILAEATRAANSSRRPGGGVLLDLDTERTYLVEIIYPGNRIVVDYHGRRALDLLGVIDRRTGVEVMLSELTLGERNFWDVAGRIADPLAPEVYGSPHNAHVRGFDAEGYVFLYADGTRLKVKHEDYVRLHRIMTGLSSRDVWRHAGATMLRATSARVYSGANVTLGVPKEDVPGLDLEKLRSEVPEEMLGWLDGVKRDLDARAAEIVLDVLNTEHSFGLQDRSDRSARAAKIKAVAGKDKFLESMLFAEHDQRLAAAWKRIKPERETFKEDDE